MNNEVYLHDFQLLLEMAHIDDTLDTRRLVAHCAILQANSVGAPQVQQLRMSSTETPGSPSILKPSMSELSGSQCKTQQTNKRVSINLVKSSSLWSGKVGVGGTSPLVGGSKKTMDRSILLCMSS
jgi:hypothetical protein